MTPPLMLRLLPGAGARLPDAATAWFIPSGDPHRWLHELPAGTASLQTGPCGSGGVPACQAVRLAVIPTSTSDLRPCGVLVLGVSSGEFGIPFSAIDLGDGRTLYLPYGARLCPPVDSIDLASLFTADVTVWHPGCGPVSFSSDELLTPVDLVAAPAIQRNGWTRAQPGERAARLLGIVAPPLPSVEQVLNSGRDDITSQSPQALPPAPTEPGTLAKGGHLVLWGLARGVDKVVNALPHTGSSPSGNQPTVFDRLQQWARQVMANNDPRLDDARHQELQRLLQALADDPDRGLRFALPLAGGDGEHRGVASPGISLTARLVDFSSRFGGGQAVDPWSIDPHTQVALRARYLELAQREISLGRHRRAAYIYATLLGNLSSAAQTLEQGRHYRDAAALYLERLKQPLEAARALQRGGIFDEAARLFTAHGDHLAAAECHRQGGQLDEAQASWRAAVAALCASQDVLRAADILVTHLDAADEALALLSDAWPTHPQAGKCLAARISLLGRCGRHTETSDLIEHLVDHDDGRSELVLEALIQAHATYPEPEVGSVAADAGRRLVSRCLLAGAASGPLLKRLHALSNEDRLLATDAARWSRRPQAQAQASRGLIVTSPLMAFELGKQVAWHVACATADGLLAAGWNGEVLVVARAPWKKPIPETTTWPGLRWAPLVLFPLNAGRAYLRARSASGGWEPVATHILPATDRWPHALTVGTFGPLHGTVAAVAPAYDGGWRMLLNGADGWMLIHAHTSGAAVIRALPELPADQPALLSRVGQYAVIVVGSLLGVLDSSEPILIRDLGHPILALYPHPDEEAADCVIARTANGCIACWYDGKTLHIAPFAESFSAEHAGFTPDGTLVVLANDGTAHAFTCAIISHVRHLVSVPDIVRNPTAIIALVPGPGPRSIVAVSATGSVSEYVVPEVD